MQKYFLGVDGGNTKTDYLLCTVEGDFVDVYHTGTCSHEAVEGGYDGMERAMRQQLSHMLDRNRISVSDIAAAGFGLAGADLPGQVTELKKRVEKIGFNCYGLFNDGILGIKGASDSGVGLCAVNGTGTVVIGMDDKGSILQVGGVGALSGDHAGGSHIRNEIISRMYDFYYRCGADSIMFPRLLELLNAPAGRPDAQGAAFAEQNVLNASGRPDVHPEDMLTLVSDHDLLYKNTVSIIQIGDKAALAGDTAAKSIFDEVGRSIGRSVAGCIRNLSFKESSVDVVLVGSIWHKAAYGGMQAAFIQTAQELSGKICRPIKLEAPPAVGGVLWAKECADNAPVPADYRKKLLAGMEKYL
jgi:N-acetylglucosamine kinase-like BadF-type ATPase